MVTLLEVAEQAEEMGIGAAEVKEFLKMRPANSETAARLVEFAVDIRSNIRDQRRTEPNAIEAEALVLISRAASWLASTGVKVSDMCFLSRFEMDDYEAMTGAV
ncbi:hypothetical protein [Pantoea septica]|uniref:hypothetical protein n=1 Tax=Pantoea septica TaxID=472695 RepID=UPI0023F6B0A1|nr:hypothetical protein [Pantoea septica]